MGLYSTNRVKSVTDEPVAENVQDEFTLEGVEPDYSNIMEMSLQIYEMDMKMFDTLIEADFIEATNNRTLGESAEAINEENDETKKVAIGEKVKKLIEFVVDKIKKAAAAFINKLIQVFNTDKKLIEMYRPLLAKATTESFKDFGGVSGFTVPQKLEDGEVIKIDPSELTDSMKTVDVAKEVVNKKTAELESDEYISKFIKVVDGNWKPESGDISAIVHIMDSSKTLINEIKKDTSEAISSVKGFAKTTADNLGSASAAYEKAKLACTFTVKSWNTFRALRTKQLAAARKGMIILGRYLKKGNKAEAEENANESVMYEVLGEASDAYIVSVFGN